MIYLNLLVNYDQAPAQPGSIQGTLAFYCIWKYALFDRETEIKRWVVIAEPVPLTDPSSTQEEGGLYTGYYCSWFYIMTEPLRL